MRAASALPSRDADPLRAISPVDYVERLTGRRPDRTGKLRCPFHADTRPSLHVYPDPDQGWFCFGCRRGGSIYDFAVYLWHSNARGHAFLELRRTLAAVFD